MGLHQAPTTYEVFCLKHVRDIQMALCIIRSDLFIYKCISVQLQNIISTQHLCRYVELQSFFVNLLDPSYMAGIALLSENALLHFTIIVQA